MILVRTPKQAPAKLRILVVEDDADTAEVMQRILARAGFDVHVAGTYKQAISEASGWVPDLLICDIGLPGKDGLEVMKAMRQAYPGLRGLVVSGNAEPDDVSRSRDAGFAGHLPKPVDFDTLVSTIRRLAASPEA